MYKNIDILNNSEFNNEIKNGFNLTEIEYRSIKSIVETKVRQIKTNKSSLENEIVILESEVKELRETDKRIKKQTEDLFKTQRKLDKKINSLPNDIVFGTRALLSYYTHLHNKLNNLDENSIEFEKIKAKIEQKQNEYRESRLNNIYVLGEANYKGNRFFEFDLKNKTIYYKPKRGIKIEIKFSNYKCHKEELLRIQELIDSKRIAVTVNLNCNEIQLSVDDTIFNDYKIDEKSRSEETEKIKELHLDKDTEKDLINKIYVKYYRELDNRKLKDKLSCRYMGVDLNPNHIGISILDLNKDNTYNIVYCRQFDLLNLSIKLPREASHKERKKQNDTRKLAISLVWKEIFRIFAYYKCGHFVLEELNLKNKDLDSREANRKINNLWHRTLTNHLIEKYSNKLGIIILKINPVYSSLIGNLYHEYSDPVNASIEICRRGLFQYKKGYFYPPINIGTISNTMSRINNVDLRDVLILKDDMMWKEVYDAIKKSGLRYRANLNEVNHRLVSKLFHVGVRNIEFQTIT